MSSNVSEVLARWNLAAIEERARAYAYAGLRPIKKTPTYYLVMSPLAVVEELFSKISSLTSDYIADMGNTPNHGFTMYAPKGRAINKSKPVKDAKHSKKNLFSDVMLKDHPNMDEYTLVLTYETVDNVRQLQCHIYKPEKKIIPISLADQSLQTEITKAIADLKKQLTPKQYKVVATELAKHGYFLKSHGFLAKLEKQGEMTAVWGRPIFQKGEVNILNAYLSWKDFFNDVKALIVKPITVFLLGIGHIVWAIWKLCCGIGSLAQRNPNALAQFDEALQSLLKALIYSVLSYHWVVAIAQGLSIMTRMLMTIPNILDKIPGAFNACAQQGFSQAAGGEFRRFATGFGSMFSRNNDATPAIANTSANSRASHSETTATAIARDPEAVRTARLNRLGV